MARLSEYELELTLEISWISRSIGRLTKLILDIDTVICLSDQANIRLWRSVVDKSWISTYAVYCSPAGYHDSNLLLIARPARDKCQTVPAHWPGVVLTEGNGKDGTIVDPSTSSAVFERSPTNSPLSTLLNEGGPYGTSCL